MTVADDRSDRDPSRRGGRHPGMSAHQIVERDRQIVEMRLRGVSSPRVAQTFGLSTDAIYRIMRAYRDGTPTFRSQDPIDIVDEMLLGYQADLEELAVMSATAKNESVRVGAVNSRMMARDRIIALLQSVGVLPNNLGNLKVEIDIRYIAQTLVTVLTKHNIPEGIQRELLTALRGEPEVVGELPAPVIDV